MPKHTPSGKTRKIQISRERNEKKRAKKLAAIARKTESNSLSKDAVAASD